LLLLPFDSNGLPVDGLEIDPSVYPASVIADLEPLAVPSLDQVKVIPTVDMNEDHIVHGQVSFLHGPKGDQVAIVHPAIHGVSPWPDLDLPARLEFLDCVLSPAHGCIV